MFSTFKLTEEQESPPAWTQEAYRPPCRKCSLCCSPNGGYPIQSWQGGYLIQSWPGGYPIQSWPGGYPIQSWVRGYPSPCSDLGPDLDGGLPQVFSPPGPGMGLLPPCPDLGWGTPSVQTWDGSWSGMGYPPPPQVWTDWNYYLLSSFGCGQYTMALLNRTTSQGHKSTRYVRNTH